MRLAGQEKGGFYPLPPRMNKYITSAIQTNEGKDTKRILDPGCGEGVALTDLAKSLNLVPFACELHEARAGAAKSLLIQHFGDAYGSHVIQDDMINIKTPREAFHVLYLNPPYDYDKESGREEYRWLKKLRPLLAPGGLLVWIIPERIIGDKNVQKYMASWFNNLAVYRFVGDSYDMFKQVVFYGTARKTAQKADITKIRAMRQLAAMGADLPQHPEFDQPPYNLDGIRTPGKFWFRGLAPNIEEVTIELRDHGITTRRDFQDAMRPEPKVRLDPLVPMKIGHIAATIAAGHINNEKLETKQGQVVIKGATYTEPVVSVSSESSGSKSKTTISTIHDPRSVITTIDAKGNIEKLVNERLGDFLSTNLKMVTSKLQSLYPPRYRFKLNEWAGYLKGVNPRRIPNTKRMGLLPAQKHSAAAVNVQWDTKDGAILVGQLGTGKTIMAIAAAYARYKKCKSFDHYLVMCPPHLVKKWIREIGLTWPAAKAMALNKVSDVDRWMQTEGPIFAVLKSTTAATGDGWSHRFWMAGHVAMERPRNGKSPMKFIHIPEKVQDALYANEDDPDFMKKKGWLNRQKIKCPSCWSPITVQDAKNKDAKLPASLRDFHSKSQHFCDKCGKALWQDDRNGKNGRYPLASYIKRQFKGRIDIAIIDEAHQYKGESSNRGHAYGKIILSSRKYVAMTGTIYGGKVSTLFYLLFRLSKEFRRNWVDKTKKKHYRMMRREWIDTYGVMEVVETTSEDTSSASTGTKRTNRNEREVAGASPAMLPWLLNRSVFVSLADMGMALPNYEEIVIDVEMNEEMKKQYNHLYGELRTALAARLVRGDRSMLSKYLYALLFFPDAAWRPKAVYEPNETEPLVSVPGTGLPVGEHPKEARILELIKEELANNRKCLLMVEQTDSLDIQPEWRDFLAQSNISSAILDVDPNKREAWIAKQAAKGTQVILSHPRRVETGLDILDYPTIIWMAPNFSIYTVLQASGRAYRLGQDQDCKVYHFAYTGTLQYQALQLVIAKAAAAKRVNGDVIDSQDLAHFDKLATDSIENALSKIMLETGSKDEAKLTEIEIDYEQVEDGIFTGHFETCETAEEAEALYKTLVEDATAANEEQIVSLADQFKQVNDSYAQESAFLGDESIMNDDDPEFYEEPEPEKPTVTVTKARIIPTRAGGVVAEVISKETVSPDGTIVKQEPEVSTTVEVEPADVTPERLVFGESLIKLEKKRRSKTKKKVAVTQLSLF